MGMLRQLWYSVSGNAAKIACSPERTKVATGEILRVKVTVMARGEGLVAKGTLVTLRTKARARKRSGEDTTDYRTLCEVQICPAFALLPGEKRDFEGSLPIPESLDLQPGDGLLLEASVETTGTNPTSPEVLLTLVAKPTNAPVTPP